jgi:hypothetical protein
MLATQSRSSGQAHQPDQDAEGENKKEKSCAETGGIMRWYARAGEAIPYSRDHDAYVENFLWFRIMLFVVSYHCKTFASSRSFIRKSFQEMDTQDHDQKTNGNDE